MYYRYSVATGLTKVREHTKKFLAAGVTGVAAIGLMAAPAMAAVSLTNGGFEDGNFANPYNEVYAGDATTINGWKVESGSVDLITSYWAASEGDQSIDLNGLEAGAISQTLTTVAGHAYTVSFDLAGNPDGGPAVKTLTIAATGGVTTPYSFDTTGHSTVSKESMGWEQRTYGFTATGTSTTLTFTSTTTEGAQWFGPALDNVTIAESLPTTKDQCKNNGWKSYGTLFKNQGDCVSFVATGGRNLPAGL